MKQITTVLMALILVTGFAMVAAGRAEAGTPAEASTLDYTDADVVEQMMVELNSSPDPLAAFEALDDDAKEAAIRWVTPASETETETIVADIDPPDFSVRCKTKTKEKHKRNSFGRAYLTYSSSTRYCYDGRQIVGTPHFTREARIAFTARLTWTFEGHIDKSTSWGPNRIYWKDYTKGRFKYKLGPYTRYWEPSITKTCFGNGG